METAQRSAALVNLPTVRENKVRSRSVPKKNGDFPTRQPANADQIGAIGVLPSHPIVPGRTRSPVASARFSVAVSAAASSDTGGELGGGPAGVCLSRGGQSLARWLLTGGARMPSTPGATRSRLRQFVRRTQISTAMLERLLDGEVIPAGDDAIAIAGVTKGAVKPEDWEAKGE